MARSIVERHRAGRLVLSTLTAKWLGVIVTCALAGCHDWDALDRTWANPDAAGCATTLVANGTFEQGTQGWGTNTGATLTQGPGHGGGSAAQICSGAGGPDRLHDVPPSVMATVANQRYTLVVWTKPGAATEQIRVNLEELDGTGALLDSNFQIAATTLDWTSVLVQHTVSHPGNALSVEILDKTGAPDTCYEVDDVCLTVSTP
jgi:hypothetical protein